MMVRPISLNASRPWLRDVHRHLRPPVGWLFGVEILDDSGARIGIACAGRPTARNLQDGETCEITRVCTDGHRNACSFAYGALRRAAVALGYRRIYTYTTQGEMGSSVRAADFVLDAEHTGGGASRSSIQAASPGRRPTPKDPLGVAGHCSCPAGWVIVVTTYLDVRMM